MGELFKTFVSKALTVFEADKPLNLVVAGLIDISASILKIGPAVLFLYDEGRQQFDFAVSRNLEGSRLSPIEGHDVVAFLTHAHDYLLVSKIKEEKVSVPDALRDLTGKLKSELIIPVFLHDKVIGILLFGKKNSGEDYVQDEIEVLLLLSRILSVTIFNAQLFDELSKIQAEAAHREKMAAIGTLSAGINHEICNPLGISRGQCEAFLLNMKDGLYKNKTTEELLQKAQEIMAKVIRETDRATVITKRLSTFAKPAKGEVEMVDIDAELKEVSGLVGHELKLDKIEFKKDISERLPHILVDKKQFQEVLFNLLRNAGQAIGEKGKIVVSAKSVKDKVVIDIQDTGSGIPEDKVKMLFNPFFTTKDPGKGTGLGLFMVRQVVERNGGKIYMKDTKVGGGTTFTIEFPAARQQEAKV